MNLMSSSASGVVVRVAAVKVGREEREGAGGKRGLSRANRSASEKPNLKPKESNLLLTPSLADS